MTATGKRLPPSRRALSLTVALMVCAVTMILGAACISADPDLGTQPLHPLAPPDTSSPRATLKTFVHEMNEAVAAYKADRRPEVLARFIGAVRCLNLESEPPAIRNVLGFYTALYLKETLDRIEIPRQEDIPDAQAVATEKLSRWTIPYTEITIGVVHNGPTGDQFLFTPDTVQKSEEFYNKVKKLPYKPGATGALYKEFSSTAGPMVPKVLVDLIPRWANAEFFGQAIWQWTGLALFFVLGSGLVLFAHNYSRDALGILDTKLHSRLKGTIGGLLLPIFLIIFARTGLWFVIYGLHFRDADVYFAIAFVFLLISYFGTIWLIGAALNRAAAVVIAVGRLQQGGMQAQLTRFSFEVLTAVIVVGAAINLGARLGLPTYSLVTGLGVGGLAVALAGREALSNLIGTVAILLDQPFKVGDFIVLGETDRGTVTEIGLRSTRIRTRDGILVSIPNSNIASMKIVNESAPVAEARIRLPVSAAYGSNVHDVEEALLDAALRCAHVVSEPGPSVRLIKFGDSALDFQLFVWIVTPELRGRVTNELNRAICEEFKKRGIEMPFPQREIRIRRNP
jgi:MscS family membrane protein